MANNTTLGGVGSTITASNPSQCPYCGGQTGYHFPNCIVVNTQRAQQWQQAAVGQFHPVGGTPDKKQVEQQDNFADWVLWVRWSRKKKLLLAISQLFLSLNIVGTVGGVLWLLWSVPELPLFAFKLVISNIIFLPISIRCAARARDYYRGCSNEC